MSDLNDIPQTSNSKEGLDNFFCKQSNQVIPVPSSHLRPQRGFSPPSVFALVCVNPFEFLWNFWVFWERGGWEGGKVARNGSQDVRQTHSTTEPHLPNSRNIFRKFYAQRSGDIGFACKSSHTTSIRLFPGV